MPLAFGLGLVSKICKTSEALIQIGENGAVQGGRSFSRKPKTNDEF